MPRSINGNAAVMLQNLVNEERTGVTLSREERKAVLRAKKREAQQAERNSLMRSAGDAAYKEFVKNPAQAVVTPAMCDNGVATVTVSAVAVHPIPPHVVPHNPQNAGEYSLPFPACKANGCTYCNQQRTNFMAHLRTRAYDGCFAMLANEERTLNRRLTWYEFLAIFNHFTSREKPLQMLGFINFGSTSYPRWYHHTEYAFRRDRGDVGREHQPSFADCAAKMARHKARFDAGVLHYVVTDNLEQRALQAKSQAEYNLRTKWAQEDRWRNFSESERLERVANARAKADVMKLASHKEPAAVPASATPVRPTPPDIGYCDCNEDYDGNVEPCGYCIGRNRVNARNAGSNVRKSPNHGIPVLAKPSDKVKRLVGLEVEFNQRADLSAWILKWNGAIHEDGSCGWEAVTTPIGGTNIDACLRDLTATMREKRVTADQRCGVHVHVDAGDVKWVAMRRLIKLYAKVEPILYMLGGQQRIGGTYCHTAGTKLLQAAEAEDYKSAILAAVYGLGSPEAGRERQKERPGKKDGGRYKGLNIIPWLVGRRKHAPDTTVEFRMHRNCLNAGQLSNWAKLCASLVEWAVNATDRDVEALPRSALRTLCQVVAPGQAKWILRLVKDWRHATTADKSETVTTVAGTELPYRRISVKGGVFSCAV